MNNPDMRNLIIFIRFKKIYFQNVKFFFDPNKY